MYGGRGWAFEAVGVCRYELIRCTNVDFPAPAIPIVIITVGFLSIDVDDSGCVCCVDDLVGFEVLVDVAISLAEYCNCSV